MNIFLAKILDPSRALLHEEEARHCIKVLRHQIGDTIRIIDGAGNAYSARIMQESKLGVELQILEAFPGYGEPGVHIRLVFSPLRLKDRLEWMIEKGVELGVSSFQPVHCARTDKYKSTIKQERLETIILAATKQCLRSRVPVLEPQLSWKQLLAAKIPQLETALIAQVDAPAGIMGYQAELESASQINLAIGPEGDFTEEEMRQAVAQGWVEVNLGHQRLRSETAGLYGLSVLKMIKGF
ncbi:MAG: 16S rRNA (uracil(1498)-N(3))-methyltransferase [Bacteroidia bacterium]|nr:16S rRNA (uracil(1498)-N(3))-methyltransferase [Bacteroidia bacterium]